jgi:replicative superfamily II helicase
MKTDENIVVTAPTGAGKTVLFELAMIRLWQKEKEGQVVYIAPTKSLCTERANDWNAKFSKMRQKCEFSDNGSVRLQARVLGEKTKKATRVVLTTLWLLDRC